MDLTRVMYLTDELFTPPQEGSSSSSSSQPQSIDLDMIRS